MKNNQKQLLKMRSLLETTKLLNSEHDIDTILNTLLTKSLEFTPGGDMGAIFLYNEDNNMLEICAYQGMGEAVRDVKLLPGESMTGITFERKKPIFFSDCKSVQKAMGEMKEKNKKMAIAGNVLPDKINSSICCPLIYKNKVIGVLVVDNLNKETSLKEEDVNFLMDISVQATIAIINARNYKKELENNEKLKLYNQIIQAQKDKYKHSNYIHTRLTEMILNGSSITDIIIELKNLIEKDVFIIDIFYNLSYHTISEKNLLQLVNKNIPDLINHLKKEKTDYFDSDNSINYNIFPIMVNKDIMGWLCVLSKDSKLSTLDIITAERGTTIIALELFKENEISDMEQSLKGDFLDSLLLNNDTDYINKCASRYGYNYNTDHRIINIKFSLESKSDKEIKTLLKNYYQIINKKSKIHFPNSISLIKRQMIIIIIESSSGQIKDKINQFYDSFESKYNSSFPSNIEKSKYKIGISQSFNSIHDFKKAYFNSIQALKMIKDIKNKNIVYYEDLEIKRFLMSNNPKELKSFVKNTLAPLKTYKNSSKNDFIKTLKTYLQTNCNWTLTKEKLHIHGNTLTYRLNRISEILNVNLDDYNDRFRLQIAYEIQDLLDTF